MSDELTRLITETVPDLDVLEDAFDEQLLLLQDEVTTRAIVRDGALPDPDDPVLRQEGEALREVVRRAASKLRKEGPTATLTPEERQGVEAIVALVARPPLLVQGGTFAQPPEPWSILDQYRGSIERALPSVGRVELRGDPKGRPYAGTGFLVADDVLMTNRHVAELFCTKGTDAWRFITGRESGVDFTEEHEGGDSTDEFALTDIVGIHDRHDLALLRVASTSREGKPLPTPLTVAADQGEVAEGREVYVVGYPAEDERNDIAQMYRLFKGIFRVKRLQPGRVMAVLAPEGRLLHDASTLGGNSGSCVVDLRTNDVVGLHFSGEYLKYNEAVALWTLRDDPLLRGASVNFAV